MTSEASASRRSFDPDTFPKQADVLNVVLDHLTQGIAVVGPDYRVLAFNRYFDELFQLPSGTVELGADFRDILKTWAEVTGQSQQMLDHAVLQLDNSTPFEFEFPQRIKGEPRWCLLTHNPLPGKGFVRTFTDITERKQAEAAVQASEAKHRMLFDSAGDAIFIHNAEAGMLAVNEQACERLGYSHAELMSMPVGAVDAPEQNQHVPERIAKLMAQGHLTFETAHQRKDGSIVPTEVSARLISWDGQPALMSICRDITERKRAEQALQDSEAQFRSYVDNAPIGVFVCDEKGRYLQVNPAATNITGYASEELLTLSIPDILPPESLAFAANSFKEVVETGQTKGEFAFRRKNGQIGMWALEGVRLAPTRFMGLVTDITERKQAEEELTRSEATLKRQNGVLSALLKSIPLGVFMVEAPSGKPLVVNEVACELLGRGILPDVPKEKLSEVYSSYKLGTGERYPLEEMPIIRGMHGEASRVDDMQVVRPDGTQALLEVFGAPVTDDQGQVWASVVSFLDITERMQTEQTIRESEQKYRTLLDNLSSGVVVHGPDTGILLSNAMASTLLGLTADQMRGKTAMDPRWSFLQEDGSAMPLSDYPVNRVFASGEGFKSQVVGVRIPECAEPTWVLCNAYPVKDAKGQIEQAVITFTDITERKRAEEALRESENLFSHFMDYLPAIVFIKDSENKTQFVNKYMDNALGASKWLGKTVLDFLPTEFAEQLIADDLKTFQLGYQKIEESIPHLDGKLHVYETQKFIIPRSNQAPLLGGISLDITERKQAEEAMVRTLSMLESTMESTADGIMVADGKGAIVKFNAKFGELWGITEAMIAAKDENAAISFVLGQLQEPESFLKTIRDLYAAPEQISFDILALKDGRVFERYSQPQKIGDSIIGRVWSFRDITARKLAEDALHFSEQKFRTLFENLTEGVALHELVTDAAGQVVDYRLLAVNTAFERHTGLVAATAPGLLATEIYETEVPPYLAEFSQVALGGAPYVFETFFPPLDKHFRISAISPRHGQFATVFEDITDRKRREEELKQKNAEMERFTYMISHDLKSPLVTVRTFLAYLEQDLEQGKPERVAKDMGFIRNATGKMGRLLEDLLEVSRVGRVVNPPVRVDLADLIQEALAAVAGAISTQGVEIKVEVPLLTLFGDRPRLEELWQNLVENAVKYMGAQPSPWVELGVEALGIETVFFVRDNGMGIDPKFQETVFGLFEKLDAESEGTGLGLALVKRIVELYEGRIWLESEGLGRGTCFRFTLPLALKGRAKEQR